MRISFTEPAPHMPCTLFWDAMAAALRRNRRYVANAAQADMLFPAEDLAIETNWPRFGDRANAFVRGTFDKKVYGDYLLEMAQSERPLCLVNMLPVTRLPQMLHFNRHIYVADVCLHQWERSLNPRTVSMPALPITLGTSHPGPRPVVASFLGVLSHPCRQALARVHDGERFICQFVDSSNHSRKIDGLKGIADAAYVDLLQRSTFAYVPRGDALFSYRLLEAMSFGCLPVILSDGWVLPFDRSLHWPAMALHVPEAEAEGTVAMLARFDEARIDCMQNTLSQAWERSLSSLDAIVETLLQELEALSAKP